MKKPSWGSDSSNYKGVKREKVVDWIQTMGHSVDIAAAMVDSRPVFWENSYDQRFWSHGEYTY